MMKPVPRINAQNAPFWQGCNENRLVLQCCNACDRYVFYPRAACPHCHADRLEWKQVAPEGEVISHTTVRRTHHDGFNDDAPYVFAAVSVADGQCIFGQIVGPAEDDLIGRKVTIEFAPHSMGQKIPVFRIAF